MSFDIRKRRSKFAFVHFRAIGESCVEPFSRLGNGNANRNSLAQKGRQQAICKLRDGGIPS
jgi:hypothetical protein